MNEVQVSEINWESNIQSENSFKPFDPNKFAMCVRSVFEPFVVDHFGDAIIEELFRRFTKILKVSMAKEEKNVFPNVTVWLTRKAQFNDVTKKI